MFKLMGMVIGASLVLFFCIAWLDASQAKKVSSQLHNELDQVIDQVAHSSDTHDVKLKDIDVLPESIQEKVDSRPVTPLKGTESTQRIAIEETDLFWHIFWKPFTSLNSAKGFANRLTKQTGVNIEVVENENRQHMVRFSYKDTEDKQRILQLIKEKTGLQVTES